MQTAVGYYGLAKLLWELSLRDTGQEVPEKIRATFKDGSCVHVRKLSEINVTYTDVLDAHWKCAADETAKAERLRKK